MKKKDSPDDYPKIRRTFYRTPFTADVPDEYSYAAEWIPGLRTVPDASKDISPISKDCDPLGYITSEGTRRGK